MLHRVAPTEPVRCLIRYYAELLEDLISLMEAVRHQAANLNSTHCYAASFTKGSQCRTQFYSALYRSRSIRTS